MLPNLGHTMFQSTEQVKVQYVELERAKERTIIFDTGLQRLSQTAKRVVSYVVYISDSFPFYC